MEIIPGYPFRQGSQIGLVLKPELADPATDGMFLAAL
jgi:hypothetical protein